MKLKAADVHVFPLWEQLDGPATAGAPVELRVRLTTCNGVPAATGKSVDAQVNSYGISVQLDPGFDLRGAVLRTASGLPVSSISELELTLHASGDFGSDDLDGVIGCRSDAAGRQDTIGIGWPGGSAAGMLPPNSAVEFVLGGLRCPPRSGRTRPFRLATHTPQLHRQAHRETIAMRRAEEKHNRVAGRRAGASNDGCVVLAAALDVATLIRPLFVLPRPLDQSSSVVQVTPGPVPDAALTSREDNGVGDQEEGGGERGERKIGFRLTLRLTTVNAVRVRMGHTAAALDGGVGSAGRACLHVRLPAALPGAPPSSVVRGLVVLSGAAATAGLDVAVGALRLLPLRQLRGAREGGSDGTDGPVLAVETELPLLASRSEGDVADSDGTVAVAGTLLAVVLGGWLTVPGSHGTRHAPVKEGRCDIWTSVGGGSTVAVDRSVPPFCIDGSAVDHAAEAARCERAALAELLAQQTMATERAAQARVLNARDERTKRMEKERRKQESLYRAGAGWPGQLDTATAALLQ